MQEEEAEEESSCYGCLVCGWWEGGRRTLSKQFRISFKNLLLSDNKLFLLSKCSMDSETSVLVVCRRSEWIFRLVMCLGLVRFLSALCFFGDLTWNCKWLGRRSNTDQWWRALKAIRILWASSFLMYVFFSDVLDPLSLVWWCSRISVWVVQINHNRQHSTRGAVLKLSKAARCLSVVLGRCWLEDGGLELDE